MLAFCIGLGVLWLVVTLRGRSYSISGLGGILLTACICYGLGSLILLILKLRG